MSWQAYVNSLVGDATNRVVSDRADVSEGTVSRWRTGKIETPDAAQAAALARGFGRPVLEAFVAAGFLSPDEANERPAAAPSLAQLSDEELLGQVAERMRRGREGDDRDAAPMKQPPAGKKPTGGVVPMPDRDSATRRESVTKPGVAEFDPEEHGLAARRTGQPNLGQRVEEEDQDAEP